MADKSEEIVYQRRLDRSPDKKDFFNLPEKDRRVVGHLRNVMEGVHQKVSALRDEVDEKDLEVSREQALRKAAESRLDQLVDMYGDPSVNKELKDRLPRAKKGQDIRDKWKEELEDIENQMNREDEYDDVEGNAKRTNRSSGRKEKSVSFDEIESKMLPGTKTKKSRSKSADTRKHREQWVSDESDSEGEGHSRHSRHRSSYPPGYPPYTMPPYPGFYPSMYSPFTPPPPNMALGQPQMLYTPQSTVNPDFVPQNGSAHSTPTTQHGGNTSMSHGAFPVGATSLPEPTLSAHQNAMNREQTKQISLLLAELDAAKNLNKKLQEKLSEAENTLETQKISQQTLEAETEERLSGKIAAMVEEIYAAQKQRDEAMMNRMRMANEERDEALIKLKHLERSLDQLNETAEFASDMNMKGVLNSLHQAETSEDISVAGKQLVDAVNSRLRRQRQVSTEEMRAVLEERDNAVAKSKQLEAEVLRLQRLSRARNVEKEHQSTTQARLLATQQERDIALSRCQKLQEEIQTLQVYYSLHKSLSQETNLRNQFSDTLDNMEGELRERNSLVDLAQKENSRLVTQLQSVVAEKQHLAEDLLKTQHAQKEALANQEKLERLVNVLRRKINGLGSKTEE